MFTPGFNTVWIFFLSIACSISILIGIFPYHPNSFLGWVVLYFISFPVILIYQLLGEKLLGNKIIDKLSSSMRVVYGVIAIGAVVVFAIVAVEWFNPYLSKWGT